MSKFTPTTIIENVLYEALRNLEYQIATDGGDEAIECAMQQAKEALAKADRK